MEKIYEVCERSGWKVEEWKDSEIVTISKFSPAGHDFNMDLVNGSKEDFIDNLKEEIDSFDISYETYLWLDNTGHGRKKAPYDMRDLYNDFEKCLEMMKELHLELTAGKQNVKFLTFNELFEELQTDIISEFMFEFMNGGGCTYEKDDGTLLDINISHLDGDKKTVFKVEEIEKEV